MTNADLAKILYSNEDLVYGMLDKPNIIITTGVINFDNGMCNEWNEKARTIYAKDLKTMFHFGLILRNTHTNMQTISQEYLEYLLDNGGLKREDCFYLLFGNRNYSK